MSEKLVRRPIYSKELLKYKDVPVVKILAGVRRCGKTSILRMLQGDLKDLQVPEENIIYKLYTSLALHKGYDERDMYKELKEMILDKGRCYLLLDEVQEIPNWEKVLNSLLEEENVDLYVTGSNSKLLAGEISTYLTGRFVMIPIYSLSFDEYKDFKVEEQIGEQELFRQYLEFGGFPLIASLKNTSAQDCYQVVEGIYSTVVTNDIARRHKLLNQDLFERVVLFIMKNVGKTFSANSIVKFLKGEQRSISVESIYNYLKWLQEAFVIYRCPRYDIQGKSVLKTQEKYYLSDISFKYSKLGYNPKGVASSLENIVYLEMRRRGYDVYIGKNMSKEIDFIAEQRGKKVYVQVCRNLPEDSDREIDNLLAIKDNFPKYIVTLDNIAVGTEEGIEVINIVDFLMSDRW